MREGSPTASISRLLARLARRPAGRKASDVGPPPAKVDTRLPEQRLLDAAARYDRILTGDGPSRRWNDAAAAGVRTVRPTDPSEAGAPVWVRRLGDPTVTGAAQGEDAPVESGPAGRPPRERRPRR
jgi:hypothetical protein